jgi:hypothetical protein
MPDVKISDLPEQESPAGTAILPIVQSGVTYHAQVSLLPNAAADAAQATADAALPLAGGTLSGPLTVTGNATATANGAALSLAPSVSHADQLAESGGPANATLFGAPAAGQTGVYTVLIDGNALFLGVYLVRVTNIAGTVTLVDQQENARLGTEEDSTTVAFDISDGQLRLSVTKASGTSLAYSDFADPLLYTRPA